MLKSGLGLLVLLLLTSCALSYRSLKSTLDSTREELELVRSDLEALKLKPRYAFVRKTDARPDCSYSMPCHYKYDEVHLLSDSFINGGIHEPRLI